jgi:hypothetical protein
VSGDFVTVRAGIASTALGLLQRDKKTSVFAESSTAARALTPDLACKRIASSARMDAQHASRIFAVISLDSHEMPMASEFPMRPELCCRRCARQTSATRAASTSGADETLSIGSELCKKFS